MIKGSIKCKICKKEFEGRYSIMQKCCSEECKDINRKLTRKKINENYENKLKKVKGGRASK